MYSKYENSYVMFVDLKSCIKGTLTHFQQLRVQEKQDNQGKVDTCISFCKTLSANEFPS